MRMSSSDRVHDETCSDDSESVTSLSNKITASGDKEKSPSSSAESKDEPRDDIKVSRFAHGFLTT